MINNLSDQEREELQQYLPFIEAVVEIYHESVARKEKDGGVQTDEL